MATVRLAADKATLDVSWKNYFTECKSEERAYFKGKIQTGGARPGHRGQLPPPPLAPPMIRKECRDCKISQAFTKHCVLLLSLSCIWSDTAVVQ